MSDLGVGGGCIIFLFLSSVWGVGRMWVRKAWGVGGGTGVYARQGDCIGYDNTWLSIMTYTHTATPTHLMSGYHCLFSSLQYRTLLFNTSHCT